MYTLRPYQQSAVTATLKHFRRERSPAVIVLPTGAGKSLVIAELARIAKGRVLVIAHVRELVEQNFLKYQSLDLKAGIYSAGLNRKDVEEKTIFGSIQSIARAPDEFFQNFSLVIVDECHRVAMESETQYSQVLKRLQDFNPQVCILGLTATPYRLGFGWIYQYNLSQRVKQTNSERFFQKCVYELSTSFLIKNDFLTPPIKIDSPVACYDFSSLKLNGHQFIQKQIEELLKDQKRITPLIIKNIIDMSEDRQGVMIFTSSVRHAKEILTLLPEKISELIIGDTESSERAEIIKKFKNKKLKFLVNVSVLTTGFDAPHVDVIAILRPTESVSLYQQIVGRGLRLSPNKQNCLILDYTGQGHDIFSPDVTEKRPNKKASLVDVPCPKCGIINQFWGLLNPDGMLIEHYGRKCRGFFEEEAIITECGYRFRYKRCDKCGEENDISARQCEHCEHYLVDNDTKLKEAMALKDAHVLRVDTMLFEKSYDKKTGERLEVHYYDVDANVLKEYFYLNSPEKREAFFFNFIRMHTKVPGREFRFKNENDVISQRNFFRMPLFVIARKKDKKFWVVREKIFE